ncbi:MAG: dCMP deaminase family protein [archaeon]
MKRQGYISWDDYFMGIAELSAMRSKDPSTRVGACIVNNKKKIVSIGYNGFPTGCGDDKLPWKRTGPYLETKYPYVAHAELNAILNATSNLDNCKVYVTLFPCNECAKMVIQSGIKEVIFLSNKYKDTDSHKASRRMFNLAGVKFKQYVPERDKIVVRFKK